MRDRMICLSIGAMLPALTLAQTPDWTKVNDEAMRHFQALVRIDSTDPPGNETHVAEYVKKVLEAEGHSRHARRQGPGARQSDRPAERQRIQEAAADHGPQRHGPRRSLQVDFPAVQRHSARRLRLRARHARRQERSDGRDDDHADAEAIAKFRSTATSSSCRKWARKPPPAPASNIWSTSIGAKSRPRSVWRRPAACAAATASRCYATVETTEKQPKGARLVVKGPAGHGSRPLRTNAVVHLATRGRDDRAVGTPDALQRHHAELFREARQRELSRRRRPLQRTFRSGRKPRRSANTSPSTSPGLTRCCTLRSRPTSCRRAIRST